MQLTGKQIVEEGIITGFDKKNAVQQQGIDLRVKQICDVRGMGFVPAEGKTVLPMSIPINTGANDCWILQPGYYEIVFEEGCKMPNNRAMTLVQRSSMLRNGTIIRSSQFDAGFETEHIGSFMQVFLPIKIQKGARIAQTLIMETANVSAENMYKGQFQNDVQRNG